MTEFQVRTDLALEARERFEEDVEIRGVEVEEAYDEQRDIRVTVVRIRTENGAKAMGKPIGTYITLEAPRMSEPDEDYHREVSEKLAGYLKKLLDVKNEKSVLVVGLGNREVTPDALGPEAVNHLRVTRHVVREYGKAAFAREKVQLVSTIVPGVMAQTGMETLEIVRGIVAETKPDQVVVIDALAARSSKRLNRTIQISDAGIQPGSGVGNHRNSLTSETIGIPVLAIGVPTVVDSATLAADILEESGVEKVDEERLRGEHDAFMVTTRDIDQQVRDLSKVVGYGINWALQDLEIEEMNALLS